MAAHFKHRTHAARGRIYPHERHAGISRDVPVCHSARRDTGGHNPVLEQNVAVSEQKEKRQRYKKETFVLWFKVVIACIPGFVAYLLLDFVDNCYVVAAALIVYGVLFIVIENWNRGREPRVKTLEEISYKDAFIIGLFQALSIIPGTSRSGSTIIGGLVIGVSRVTAAEFTFFLAVPVMVGVSLLKIIAFGFSFTSAELITLIVGCVVAFLVSVVVIKFLMSYIKRKDFKVFGWYRIVLGVVVIAYFLLK